MAYLFRLILVFIGLLSSSAFASPGWIVTNPANGIQGSCSSTKDSACRTYETAFANPNLRYDSAGDTSCYFEQKTYGVFQGSYIYNGDISPCEVAPPVCVAPQILNSTADACIDPPIEPCADGSERIGGVCVPKCKPDETRINGVCVRNNCPKGSSIGQFTMSSSSTAYVCYFYSNIAGYCQAKVEFDIGVDTGAGMAYYGNGTTTGAECSPGVPGGSGGTGGSGGSDGSGSGGAGGGDSGGSGGTGGDSGGDPQPSPPIPPPNPQPPAPDGSCPAGSTKKEGACIKDPEPPAPDGTCPSGSVPVAGGTGPTTCVYPQPAPPGGDGGSGGSGGGETGGTGSGWGGSCAAGFACDGDAVQCAIAREQHTKNCLLFDSNSPERSLYEQEKGKTGPQTGSASFSIGPASIDSSNALGSAPGCITDKTVTVAGKPVTLPFSVICSYLEVMGSVLMAVSFLLAARIVTRG